MRDIYLIIGALNEEVDALLKRMENIESLESRGVSYYTGKLSGQNCVLALSGVGKVNAAYTTTVLTGMFDVCEIINIGSAGGLDVNQNVGDLVIADELKYHDLDFGNAPVDERYFFYPKTHDFEKVLIQLGLPYHKGLIVSGDQFVMKDSDAFKNIQLKFPSAIAVEMEATAVAAVAKKRGIPCIVLRALSDVTHHDDNDLVFEDYLVLASENSAKLCSAYMESRTP